MSDNRIDTAQAEIDGLVSETFKLKTGSLASKLRRAGRRLPRGVTQDLAYLEEARKRTAHPRRRGQLDRKRIDAICASQRKVFGRVDVARDKARERINWLGGLVMSLMLFAVAYYGLLNWLGAV